MAGSPPSIDASLERDLARVTRRCAASGRVHERNKAERDALIRQAIAASLPRARIVELTGLSPQRIDQIRRGARL